ncbi:F-type H+-transporting ATPase subunit alpha [Roseiarcus fermentans]|uniref:ATP synthase subunit alpha n=1 Tax=Roseiarcus fermentans TaxID=1473586 RepID=A0A366F4Z3_9HYPH|nr:F0F1 ATP synthase subunit alpha [Roseiarcus fermentans]RBP09687.1 F-type H+-transporting ATPase subunit alpha [Roseiarcus fermentans]
MPATIDDGDRWLAGERAALGRVDLAAEAQSVGRVEAIADGVARVSGLPETRLGELLRFEGCRMGYALSLEPDAINAAIFDEAAAIGVGSLVSATGEVARTPVGAGLLGRVVDPLGRPLDRDEPIAAEAFSPVERPAPAIVDRALVEQPVATGVLVVDALFALGRGQRELIIGDRATGKTAIAVDAIINQKRSDMICVYVAVGQRATAVERVIEQVRERGAPERCVFVVASAASSAALQWIAPFAGFAIGEYFRDRGQHALVVVDDLTKHAATHRELALLTREPPGREAFPGDIFYVHARLLERAAKLAPELGGGSLTALPIAETDAGNLSAFIPTNLISITDGQIVLDSRLFAANQRPAVDVGLSVSRVGGKAQAPALRAASGRLRLDYAQFLELEMFTRFGGLTDARVKATIARGERIRALLAQPRFATLRLVDEVALLAALADGAFDAAPAEKVAEARARIAAELDARAPEAAAEVMAKGACDDAARTKLVQAVRAIIGAGA